MTNHPHRSKRAWSTVRVSAKDARDLALMLKLHVETCEKQVRAVFDGVDPRNPGFDQTERDRRQNVLRSWARAARKARSFATQFEMMAMDAECGMFTPDNVRQLR